MPKLLLAALLLRAPISLALTGATPVAFWSVIGTGGWFVRYLWLQYLIFAISHALGPRRVVLMALILGCATSFAIAASGDPYSASFALTFAIGMVVGAREEAPGSSLMVVWALASAAVVAVVVRAEVMTPHELLQPAALMPLDPSKPVVFLARLIPPALVAILCLALAFLPTPAHTGRGRPRGMLLWLGENSLGIYLANTALQPLFQRWTPQLPSPVAFVLALGGSLLGGYLVETLGSRLTARPATASS